MKGLRIGGVAVAVFTLAATVMAQAPDARGPYADLRLASEMLSSHRTAEAEVLLTNLVERIPDSASAWYQLALARSLLGKAKGAEAAVEQALQRNDHLVEAHLLHARLLVGTDHEAAAAAAKQASELAGKDLGVLRRALDLLLQAGDLAAARDVLVKAYQQAPNDVELLELHARVALQAKELEEATQVYRKLTDLRPGDPRLWESLGRVLRLRGEKKAARDALERTLQINPSNLEARQQLIAVLEELEPKGEALPIQRKYLDYYRRVHEINEKRTGGDSSAPARPSSGR